MGGSQSLICSLDPTKPTMPGRRSRSPSPDYSRKRSKHSSYSRHSPSPTRRSTKHSRGHDYDRSKDSRDSRDYVRDNRHKDRLKDYDKTRDDRNRDRDRRDRSRERERDRPRRSRSRSRERRMEIDGKERPKPVSRAKSPQSQPSRAVSVNGTPGVSTPPVAAQPTAPMTAEEEAMAIKQARLAAWKREREAKKALDGAKAKAMALAGKTAPTGKSMYKLSVDKASHHLVPPL